LTPGTRLVQALPIETASGKVTQKSPNSWYVLNDDPALTGADIRNPMQSFDEAPGGRGAPDVTFGFSSRGKSVFEHVTKEIAHRGQEAQLPGVPKQAALQHFAVVLDGQLITVPSIDYTQSPEGINASAGSAISGGFTMSGARELAAVLGSGSLPLRLVLVSRAQR
jgi:SecD/SecF fusion protein